VSYESLVASALLGTARRPPDIAIPPGAPDDLAAALGARPPEDALLAAAAAWSVARRAGAVAGPSNPPEPAPPDPRPLCPPAAGRTLAAMLDGIHSALVREWLDLVAAAGLRPPPELLPALLELAEERPELHAAAAAAAGPRGEWLAARRPTWADDAEFIWDKGSRPARRDLLARIRRNDPAAGRALLESTWEGETPEDRAAFLAELAAGLGPDDEPFLEAVLDDRRKPVRLAAADLLWSLPGSRLGARMAERTAPLVQIGRRLDVALPADCDKGMERDGIERKPPRGTGERQFWLAQLIEATPLSTWPVEAAGKKGEWRDLLRAAWARAAVRQRDVEWARALLGIEPALLGVLPKAEREAAVKSLEDALACPGPWGRTLSERVLRALDDDDAPDLPEVATRLHPDTLEGVEALRDRGHRRLCDLAAFRAGMLRDLR
jgi:Family of unknown function (DUF5691)